MKTTRFFPGKPPKQPIDRLLSPFQHFLHMEAAGGILLLICTAVALAWANSPWSASYHELWQQELSVGLGDFSLAKPLLLWINDGLMALFFFVVGLEIKREVLVGELARPRQAALPMAAALGGMLVPAAVYLLWNSSGETSKGWGVAMATDIAFSLGVLALLGKRVPLSAKVFLTAFAIVDDIGASLVIALFYTEEISLGALGGGFVVFGVMVAANLLGVRRPLPFALLGTLLWFAFLKSGVHPTIAGILAAMTIPARTRIDADNFVASTKVFIERFEAEGLAGESVLTNNTQRGALRALETACELSQTPLQRLEHVLHGWVVALIMPVFALANAGVTLGGGLFEALTGPISLGVICGLVVGKQIGVTLFAWIAVKTGLSELPSGLTWRHIYGLSWLGAIGFTMSLFIAGLAFGDEALLSSAKVGILSASLLAGVGGWLVLSGAKPAAAAAAGEEEDT